MPEIDVRPFKANTSNENILNAIRKNASPEYQSRIPETTKASVQNSLQNLTDYRPAWNEFVDSLINRIGLVLVKNSIWTNPLAKFKRGMLQFGDTIEEINVGLIRSKTYNADRQYLERDIFGQYPPEVQSSYHKVNRQEYYPITVNEPLLQRAFLDNSGLQSFVTSVMSAPTISDQWDEFLLTTSLFNEYYNADGFFKVQVGAVDSSDSGGTEAKALIRRIREFAGNLQFLSTHYNASGMPIAVQPEELELFITPEALAAIDVEALAGAFNVQKMDMIGKITIIPKEHFNIPGAQAILTTRDFFVIADSRIETASVWNPVALSNNMFLHHWEVISASRFVPAVLFTTEASDVINLDASPVTGVSTMTVTDSSGATVPSVERGSMYQITGTAITEGENDALRLTLAGAESTRTYLTQAGVLHVSPDEDGTSFVITGLAVDDNSFVATVTVAVVGDKLQLWPEPSVADDADNDGLFEVTPDELTKAADNTVTIPTVTGVQYTKAGANVTNGSVHTITASTTFTAVGRSGYEITPGATASWTFTA